MKRIRVKRPVPSGPPKGRSEALEASLRPTAPIVPSLNIPGRSLIVVIAIMTFLACLTGVAVLAIRGAADSWQADIARELTIQIMPADGADIAREAEAAATAAREVAGVRAVRIMSEEEMEALLAPWLGTGTDLAGLPVPRLVVVEVDPAAPPDIGRLRDVIVARAPHASLDDHQVWQSRLRIMARTLTGGGLIVLGLVLAATALSVVFATRGAMAGNRDVVEVLHLVGAKENFIARQFTHHFFMIGVKGGLAGGAATFVFLGLAAWGASQFVATPAGDQIGALFGNLTVGPGAYVAVVATLVLIALLTGLTSRWAVYRFLEVFD
ncbi:MAG: cell division protein FtsX [Flavobacteriaceae bacterium]